MAPAQKKLPDIPSGTFRPSAPRDSGEVVRLFAIASRVVCARPERLDAITQTLQVAVRSLVPPERFAAEDCGRLWAVFARMAQSGKPALLEQAGLALCRDLEKIGRRLDLAPLDAWTSLPIAIDEPNAVDGDEGTPTERGLSIHAMRKRAKTRARKHGDPPLKARDVFGLLKEGTQDARKEVLESAIEAQKITRADVVIVLRALNRIEKIDREDSMLVEVLETIGRRMIER